MVSSDRRLCQVGMAPLRPFHIWALMSARSPPYGQFRIRQLRRAELAIARARGAMTAGAVFRVQPRAAPDGVRICRPPRQMHDIFRQIIDLGGVEDLPPPECGHLGSLCLGMCGADADRDGLLYVRQRPAPQPHIVIQVWIALRSLRARAVAACAIVAE